MIDVSFASFKSVIMTSRVDKACREHTTYSSGRGGRPLPATTQKYFRSRNSAPEVNSRSWPKKVDTFGRRSIVIEAKGVKLTGECVGSRNLSQRSQVILACIATALSGDERSRSFLPDDVYSTRNSETAK